MQGRTCSSNSFTYDPSDHQSYVEPSSLVRFHFGACIHISPSHHPLDELGGKENPSVLICVEMQRCEGVDKRLKIGYTVRYGTARYRTAV